MKINELIEKLEEYKKQYGNKYVDFAIYTCDPMRRSREFDNESINYVSFDENKIVLSKEKYNPINPYFKTEEEEAIEEENYKKSWKTIFEIFE